MKRCWLYKTGSVRSVALVSLAVATEDGTLITIIGTVPVNGDARFAYVLCSVTSAILVWAIFTMIPCY